MFRAASRLAGTMRSILSRYHDNPVFEPEIVEAMAHALDEVCAALDITDDKGRETIAIRIIDLARGGLADADTLRDRVLLESKSVA